MFSNLHYFYLKKNTGLTNEYLKIDDRLMAYYKNIGKNNIQFIYIIC